MGKIILHTLPEFDYFQEFNTKDIQRKKVIHRTQQTAWLLALEVGMP